MRTPVKSKNIKFSMAISLLISLLFFWAVLIVKIPSSITFRFTIYSFGLFVIILLLYYLSLRLQGNLGVLTVLGLTMLLFALALSYKWTSGFSDNFLIGGLLPYKDAKNYYLGANLILQGLPMERVGQATERPLFPGFLSSLLLLTGQNLKIALAIIVQMAGIGLYLSARQIRHSLGAVPASLYITLMYFYIQPLIGYTLSELLGFILGCFAFVLIWQTSHNPKWFDLNLGLLTLLVAVSARAGALLIFPMLVLWAGWRFREEQRFSLKTAVGILIVILVGYYLINTVYARLLGIPPGSAFGNFSYALYGQVKGGTGWHSAIEELGTRDPDSVYRAALQFFLAHPLSLFIGFAKSYRDFFLMGNRSIFPFGAYGWSNLLSVLLWMGILILLIQGLLHLAKDIRSNRSSLLLAGFAGIFLSIPFLPPVDGGGRFHASTMPFFFILPAVGLSEVTKGLEKKFTEKNNLYGELAASRSASILLTALTLIMPVGVYFLGQKSVYTVPACPLQQEPFAVTVHRGSYIDLVWEGTTPCGMIPEVCLSDFEKNNKEKATDDFYQELLLLTKNNPANVRVMPAWDLLNEDFHYFYASHGKIPDDSLDALMTGCAVEIRTKNQSIYKIESILINKEQVLYTAVK